MFNIKGKSQRKLYEDVFKEYFSESVNISLEDNQRFLELFIQRIGQVYKNNKNINFKEEKMILNFEKSQIQNTNTDPSVQYFILSISIIMIFIQIIINIAIGIEDLKGTVVFVIIAYFTVNLGILLIINRSQRTSKRNATKMAFYDLCLEVVEEIKHEIDEKKKMVSQIKMI